jgi:5,10-methylene-tetrahydrofolate dehydrogenase/methenyl tetrahydrofolate cyclohydrolase
MIVDGKAIAVEILAEVAEAVVELGRTPQLVAITCAPLFETKKYLEMKTNRAAAVGIELIVVELPFTADTETAIAAVTAATKNADGVVVQLPLPAHIDSAKVLSAVPADKDPDGFLYGEVDGACFSPVVGAIDEISNRHAVEWTGKQVVVLGEGRLVGRPAAAYARVQGAVVTVLTKETYSEDTLRTADIIISGIGQPHFIKPNMIKAGAVIFDAGTSEDGGVLAGDVDPSVATVAALITPVPGGIGPITIAYLLRNLVKLAE